MQRDKTLATIAVVLAYIVLLAIIIVGKGM